MNENNKNHGGNFSILPAFVRHSQELNGNEKVLYSEITALSNKKGYCFASNKYLSELYDVSTDTISRQISKLRKKGFLNIELIKDGNEKEIKERRIYPALQESDLKKNLLTPDDDIEEKGIYKNHGRGIRIITDRGIDESTDRGIGNFADDNNISLNNINNNNINNMRFSNASEIKKQKDKEIEEQFKEWYDIYDKKRDRAKALKSFKTKYKKHGYEKILEGTKAYLKTVTDKQYQKYPATFLNAESYLDIEEFNNTSKNRPDNNAIEGINLDEI